MPVGSLESNEKGTGARFNDGKPPMELIPLKSLRETLGFRLGHAAGSAIAFDRALGLVGEFQQTGDRERLLDAYFALLPFGEGVGGPYAVEPLHVLEARVFGFGAKKYAAWNWTKGMAWSVPLGCIARHFLKLATGEQNDPESGIHHVGHIACNIRMLLHFTLYFPEGNDLPPAELFELPARPVPTPADDDTVTVAGVSLSASELE